jgi:cell division inhibitor SepF
MSEQSESSEYEGHKAPNFFSRLKDRLIPQDDKDDDEDDEDDEPAIQAVSSRSGGSISPVRKPTPALRIDTARRQHITVRRAVYSFDDARRAADGLKSGQQQIVNLEQTPTDMTERIVDFLNGATYAIDGSVEKIGEQVYLFTPNSVTIDIEERSIPTSRPTPSFLDR